MNSSRPAAPPVIDFLGEILKKENTFKLRVGGGSMFPILAENDWVTLTGVDPKAIQRGDIIAYRVATHLFMHRVIFKIPVQQSFPFLSLRFTRQIDPPSFIYLFKGDALRYYDGLISAENLVGRVVEIEKPWGSLRLDTFWHQVYGNLMVLVSPVSGYLLSFVRWLISSGGKSGLIRLNKHRPEAGPRTGPGL